MGEHTATLLVELLVVLVRRVRLDTEADHGIDRPWVTTDRHPRRSRTIALYQPVVQGRAIIYFLGMLRFIHLSDVHFSKRSDSGVFDLDRVVRSALETDLREKVQGTVDGLLITGDIAFSGRDEEFAIAGEWLAGLAVTLGLANGENGGAATYVVPGNHDVDRKRVGEEELIKTGHRALRECDRARRNDLMRGYYTSERAADLMLSPFEAYTRFAAPHKCHVGANRIAWSSEVAIVGGYRLRLHGLNSAIASDEHDETERLVLGEAQLNIVRQAGLVEMTLCHHPPSHLIDQDDIESLLAVRADIQLFGHRHQQNIENINGNLRIHAGAMQPNRNEADYFPCYNILTIDIDVATSELIATVEPRRWSKIHHRFGADADWNVNTFKKRVSRPPITELRAVGPSSVDSHPTTLGVLPEVTAKESAMTDPLRRISYRYLSLPLLERLTIAEALGLFKSSDEAVHEPDRSVSFIERALEEKKLSALWDEVDAVASKREKNPFKRSE